MPTSCAYLVISLFRFLLSRCWRCLQHQVRHQYPLERATHNFRQLTDVDPIFCHGWFVLRLRAIHVNFLLRDRVKPGLDERPCGTECHGGIHQVHSGHSLWEKFTAHADHCLYNLSHLLVQEPKGKALKIENVNGLVSSPVCARAFAHPFCAELFFYTRPPPPSLERAVS